MHLKLNQDKAKIAEGSLFQYKYPQTPHFVEKENNSRHSFSLSLSLSLSPKHIKTPQNTLDSHIFYTTFKFVFLHLIFLCLVPYLGFEVQRCGCSFLAIIHTPFSLLLFLSSFCLMKCFICFSQHVLASNMFYSFPSMSTCFFP